MWCKFNVGNFLFEHSNLKLLVQGRWVSEDYVSVPYLIYRTIICAYFLGLWISGQVINAGNVAPAQHWIYFTDLAFGLFTFTVVLEYILALLRFLEEGWNGKRHQYEAIDDYNSSAIMGNNIVLNGGLLLPITH